MARPVLNFHPWDSKDILEELRSKFYPPPNYAGPDMRQSACQEVDMWKMKRPIPTAIESTGLITQAILRDHPDELSVTAVELLYGTAFSRYVTLFVDCEQKRSHKENMYDVGRNIGLPTRFVELRHEINHGTLPPLGKLRMYAQQALDWLYNDYWKSLGVAKARKYEDLDLTKAFSLSLLDDLISHRRKGLELLNAKDSAMKVALQNKSMSGVICTKVVKFCHNDIAKLGLVVHQLLNLNILVSSSKKPGSSMADMFRVWNVLLWALSEKQSNFLQELTGAMALRLVLPYFPQIKNDGYREGLGQWLVNIFTDGRWRKTRDAAGLKIIVLMDTCLANPCFWTLHVALAVITKKAWRRYRPLFEKKILDAMEADKGSNAEAEGGEAMDTADGNDNEVAEGSGGAAVGNDEPATYVLDTVAAALLDAEEDGEEQEGAVEAPSVLTYTLCLRTMKNPWYTTPVGTFK